MFSKARVTLVADRGVAFSRLIRFVGVDLTGATHEMEVRDRRDGGTSRAELATTTTVGAEGIRLVDVVTTDGVPTSTLHVVISKATMNNMAAVAAGAGATGGDGRAVYDLITAPTTSPAFVSMQGDFVIAATATDTSLTGGTGPGDLTIIEVADNGTTVVVAGAVVASSAQAATEAARDETLIARDQAVSSAQSAVNAPGTSGTSTSSLTLSAGSKSINTQTGKAWVPGQPVMVSRTSDAGASRMFATITAYSGGTLTVNVASSDDVVGSGTFSDWSIALCGPKAAGGIFDIPGGTLSGGARTTVPINFRPPTGSQTNSLGGSDAVNYSLITSTSPFTQGPTGHANYYDNVMSWAGNANGNLTTRTIAEMPIFRIAMESKFAQGGAADPFLTEWHLVSLFPTSAAGEFRGISAVVPHDSTKWETHSIIYLRGAQLQLAAGAGPSDIYGQFDTKSSTARFVDWVGTTNGINFRHRFNKNGNAVLQQMNAAGNAWLNLPFYNANDAIDMGGVGTIIANGAAKTSSITSLTGMFHMNASGMAADGTMHYMVSSTAITGKLTAAYYQFNASTYGENVTINAGAGAAGYRIRTSAGRQFFEFHDNTGNRHIGLTYYPTGNGSLALDNAQQGGQFANKTSFTVDYATFQCQFGYAPKLPSSLVASLPAAATAGAGSLQYVTNLNATTAGSVAAGGGSNKGVVVCDGTDWRIMTAW